MGIMGVLVGREAAVFLRIQAQVALCELSIAERSPQEEAEADVDKKKRRSQRFRVPLTARAR